MVVRLSKEQWFLDESRLAETTTVPYSASHMGQLPDRKYADMCPFGTPSCHTQAQTHTHTVS